MHKLLAAIINTWISGCCTSEALRADGVPNIAETYMWAYFREAYTLVQPKWNPPDLRLPENSLSDAEAVAAIIGITGGNFRLLHRLLAQASRLMEINGIASITRQVVETARESLS